MNLLKKFWNEEDGQDLIEYALLAGAIALFTVAAVNGVGTALNGAYGNVSNNVTKLPGTTGA